MTAALVLVSGAPGTGKTTLARKISADLGMALLTKDTIKEALGEALGAESVEQSQDLGRASVSVLYALAREQLAFDVPVIVESAFHQALAGEVEPLVARVSAVLVHCHAPDEVLTARALARAADRHAVHFDSERVPFDNRHYGVMELDIPTLFVDTEDGYRPDYPTILSFVETAHRGRGRNRHTGMS
jgi:predicted kinase